MKIVATAVLALLSTPVQADEVTPKDIQVIGRTLGFMEETGTGTLELAIGYVRGELESVRQARTMQASLGDGLSIGKLLLKPSLVVSDELATLDRLFVAELFEQLAFRQDQNRPIVRAGPIGVGQFACNRPGGDRT